MICSANNCYKGAPVTYENKPMATETKKISKNTEITPHFLVWKFCGNAQFFQTKNLGEISVFYVVGLLFYQG